MKKRLTVDTTRQSNPSLLPTTERDSLLSNLGEISLGEDSKIGSKSLGREEEERRVSSSFQHISVEGYLHKHPELEGRSRDRRHVQR